MIYQKYKNDRKNYIRCYNDILEYHPTLDAYLLLGDAYMNIQDPDEAVKVYFKALEAYPNETSLKRKIGHALTKTHDYKKAVKYYEDALTLADAESFDLRYDLSILYFKLKMYEKAERLSKSTLSLCQGTR